MRKVLLIVYVNMNESKGDAAWARETIRNLDKEYTVEVIAVNVEKYIFSSRCWNVPFFTKRGYIIWNLFSLILGIWRSFIFKPDIIYADGQASSVSPMILSKLFNKPLILEIHTPFGAQDISLYRSRSSLYTTIAKQIEHRMLYTASLVVASDGWAKLINEMYQIPQHRFLILPLAVNTSIFRPLNMIEQRYSLNLAQDCPIAVWVGNIGPWQGINYVIEAAPYVLAEHPDAIFLIVGDGAVRNELSALVNKKDLGRSIKFVGAVSYECVPNFIASANVGLAPFPSNRGQKNGISSLKTLNYLACGKAVIASEMDEMAHNIVAYQAGIVIPPDDPKALAEAICRVFEQIDTGGISKGALKLAEKIPTWEERIKVVINRVNELLR